MFRAPHVMKSLQPGRVILIYIFKYKYIPAIVLKISNLWLTVLLLCNQGDDSESAFHELIKETERELKRVQIYECLKELFIPDPPLKHVVVDIPLQFLIDITDEIIKIEASKIIDDYRKRQLPRFQ